MYLCYDTAWRIDMIIDLRLILEKSIKNYESSSVNFLMEDLCMLYTFIPFKLNGNIYNTRQYLRWSRLWRWLNHDISRLQLTFSNSWASCNTKWFLNRLFLETYHRKVLNCLMSKQMKLDDDCAPPSSDWIEKFYSISAIYLSNLVKIFNVPLNSSSSLSYLLIKFAVSLLHVSWAACNDGRLNTSFKTQQP